MPRLFLVSGAVLAAVSIVLGTAGSHAFSQEVTPEELSWFDTALRYHQFSALGMLTIGILIHTGVENRWLTIGGIAVFAGCLLFCGCLYAMSFGAPRMLGALTPIGGILMIAGWISVTFGLLVTKRFRFRGDTSC